MNYVTVTEIDLNTFEHLRYFKFPLNEYRSIVSYNAFSHGSKHRNQNLKQLKFYHCELQSDPNSPTILFDSIWNFYKFVGYNYKLKKWLT